MPRACPVYASLHSAVCATALLLHPAAVFPFSFTLSSFLLPLSVMDAPQRSVGAACNEVMQDRLVRLPRLSLTMTGENRCRMTLALPLPRLPAPVPL